MSAIDYLDLCRLCLVKDQVSVSIFEDEGANQQIFHKIATCLPVKVNRDDRLPQKLCNECVCKVEMFYQYWNTTANAEKQLLQWLNDAGDDKQTYVLDSNVVKSNQSEDEANDQTNNISINVIQLEDMPIMISGEEQMPSVSMTSSTNVQPVAGTSSQAQIIRKGNTNHEVEEGSTEDDNTEDDECDVDEGLKEEIEVPNAQPSYVTIPCDAPGPSGLQQQKMEIEMQQDDDPKSGSKSQHGPEKIIKLKTSIKKETVKELKTYSKLVKYHCQKCDIYYKGFLNHPKSKLFLEVHSKPHINKCGVCGSNFVKLKDLLEHKKNSHGTSIQIKPGEVSLKVIKPVETESKDESNSNKIKKTISPPNKIMTRSATANVVKLSSGKSLLKPEIKQAKPTERKIPIKQTKSTVKNKVKPSAKADIEVAEQQEEPQEQMIKYVQDRSGNIRPVEIKCKVEPIKGEVSAEIWEKFYPNRSMDPSKIPNCEKCNQEFRSMKAYEKHDCEFNEQAGLCHFCGYESKTQTTLRWHISVYHTECNFLCHMCDKRLATQAGLDMHIRYHYNPMPKRDKYECDLCKRKFKEKCALRQHLRTHTGEKPYVCSICSAKFAKRETLRQHLLIHTGKRPYICDICGRSYRQKPALTAHRKSHPGILPPMPVVYIDSYINEVDPQMVSGYTNKIIKTKFRTQNESFDSFISKY